MSSSKELFQSEPGFCADCGSILPNVLDEGGVECYLCGKKHLDAVNKDVVTYTIYFNAVEARIKNYMDEQKRKQNDDEAEGPIIERKCPKCGNNQMSYATLQLRSADEGQTVFYTCTKCKYKESENS